MNQTRWSSWQTVVLMVVMVALLGGCSFQITTGSGAPETAAIDAADPYVPKAVLAGSAELTPFEDADGRYALDLGADWTPAAQQLQPGWNAWYVGPTRNGFTPNVNVFVEQVRGLDLDDYLALTERNMGLFASDVVFLEHGEVQTRSGERLAVLVYQGTIGVERLQVMQTLFVQDGQAVVASLTGRPEDFGVWREATELSLLSLRPAS